MSKPTITVKNIKEILDKHDKGNPDQTIKHIWKALDDEADNIYIEADSEVYVLSPVSDKKKVNVRKLDKKTGEWSQEKTINKKKSNGNGI